MTTGEFPWSHFLKGVAADVTCRARFWGKGETEVELECVESYDEKTDVTTKTCCSETCWIDAGDSGRWPDEDEDACEDAC